MCKLRCRTYVNVLIVYKIIETYTQKLILQTLHSKPNVKKTEIHKSGYNEYSHDVKT